MHITNSSNVSDPEIIQYLKIHKYVNNNLFVGVTSRFKFVNPVLWLE